MKIALSAALRAFNATGSIIALAVFCVIGVLLLQGCTALKVTDYGHEVVRDSDGKPLVDKDGKVQTVHKGQRWHYNKNMVDQSLDDLEFTRKQGDVIGLKLRNYKDAVSPELNKVIESSFKGAAELAAKVGAAIATSGGRVAGEAGASLLKKSIANYLSKGGSAEKAKITCENGSCTFTDGTITETCTDCLAK